METGKMTWKHGALVAVILLCLVYTAQPYVRDYLSARGAAAQAGGGPGGGPGGGGGNPQQMMQQQRTQMTQDLQLTPAQQDQIKSIQDSAMPEMRAIRQDQSLSREQRREKMRPLREAMEARIKALLTPEQQVKYEARRAQRRARFGGGAGGGPGMGGANGPGAAPPNSNAPAP